MFYIPAFNGINSAHSATNSIGLTSINGPNRWSKDGSYEKLFEASVIHLLETDQLDTSRLHGDGSNTVVKKGVLTSDIQDTNTRKVKKN